MGFPGGTTGKEPACPCKRFWFNLWVWKIPWRRATQGRGGRGTTVGGKTGYNMGIEPLICNGCKCNITFLNCVKKINF